MKKIYSKPEISVLHIDCSSAILAASGDDDYTDVNIDDSDKDYGNKGDETPGSGGWVIQR